MLEAIILELIIFCFFYIYIDFLSNVVILIDFARGVLRLKLSLIDLQLSWLGLRSYFDADASFLHLIEVRQ